MVDPTLLTQAKQLTPADRLELIGELWQTLDHDELPVSDADRDLLDDRFATLQRTRMRAAPGKRSTRTCDAAFREYSRRHPRRRGARHPARS